MNFLQGRARAAVMAFLSFAVAYNIPRFFEITWEPVAHENATGYYVEIFPGENITETRPTDLRMNSYYIRLNVHSISP